MNPLKQRAVSDSGPVIHLSEVNALSSFGVFKEVLVPPEVKSEIAKFVSVAAPLTVTRLNAAAKDLANIMTARYGLGLGETEAIALALHEKIVVFLTDDLEARTVAKIYDLEPHGTLGIILRAFREGKLSQAAAIEKVKLLHEQSTLFLTKDLVIWIIRQIEGYKP